MDTLKTADVGPLRGFLMNRRPARRLFAAAGCCAIMIASLTGCGRPEVGDCVAVTGEDSISRTDCSSPEAQYRVIAVKEEGGLFGSVYCDDVPDATMAYSVGSLR